MGPLGYVGAVFGIFVALIVALIVGCLVFGGCNVHYHVDFDGHGHPHSAHHREGMVGGGCGCAADDE